MNPAPARLVVLASGRGTNLQAILDACAAGTLSARVVAVLSDRAEAGALRRARELGIPGEHLDPRPQPDRDAYDAVLAARVAAHAPDLVVLAGFMRILSAAFVARFLGRLVNIHPSLLPDYPGLHTHRRVLADGRREHGASVHFVTPELDGGPVIMQARVPVLPGDDEPTLIRRVLTVEHRLYPAALALVLGGQVAFRDGSVYKGATALPAPLELDA
jgi:phosphoribosylglycinamide formyltransferase-1